MKKIVLVSMILSLFLFSCSKESVFEQEVSPDVSTELINSRQTNGLKRVIQEPVERIGYGIFDNTEYDYGWKVGYKDALQYKKHFVETHVNFSCFGFFWEIKVVENPETHERKYFYEHDVKFYECAQINEVMVLQAMKNSYSVQSYLNTLYAKKDLSDCNRGMYDGFKLLLNASPYTEAK
jgi:hypothetical protein